MRQLHYQPTPIQELTDEAFDRAGVRVLMKREDLNHPYVSGNKWWKLKYNLEEAYRQGKTTLLTFGGAYSNHIYATAAAAHELGLQSIGIIRGEETLPLNPVLTFAASHDMQLHYLSRSAYRSKHEPDFISVLRDRFGDFYLIPEGGTNKLAVKGVAEFAQTLGSDFDYLCCAVGTGGTMAGLIRGLDGKKKIIGFPVLKGASYLQNIIEGLLEAPYDNWALNHSYHLGGFAKMPAELKAFRQDFQHKHGIKIDLVYMTKLVWAVSQEIKSGKFERGCTIMVLHSGGLP